MYPTFSVLMATYANERPERLARAFESVFGQTLVPDQMVLTVDGPIDAEQDAVIARYQRDPRIRDVRIVRLGNNVGLGPALNAGLEHCTGDWIMRMDSDDESLLDRAQVQVDYVIAHPDVDLVFGWSEEFFDNSPETRIKDAPEHHDAVVRKLKWRNTLVHPCAFIRASTLRSVGGYRNTFNLLEDWDLWVRLALTNARFAVVQRILLRMLVGKDQAARRGGLNYIQNEARFRTFCWTSGFINFRQYVVSTTAYMGFRLLGPTIRGRLYGAVRTQGVTHMPTANAR
jgi:glycosyltransferase involved in cell wall biosynthesis